MIRHEDSKLKLNSINNCPICTGLGSDEIKKISSIVCLERFKSGDIVYLSNSRSFGFYVLHNGRVKLSSIDNQGRELITNILGPGKPFGENSIFKDNIHTETAVALENSVLLFVPAKSFLEICNTSTQLTQNIINSLCHRVTQLNTLIGGYTLFTAKERVIHYLSGKLQSAKSVMLTEKKYEIAHQIGVRPETFSRILKQLEQKTIIKVEGKKISVVNASGLEQEHVV